MLAGLLLHRWWIPSVTIATMAVVVATLTLRASPQAVVFAGCYAPETGPQTGIVPDGIFRWTRKAAAVKLPVRGPVLVVPVYLARPDIDDGPIDVTVDLGGWHTAQVTFTGNGWHVLSFDLVEIAGEAGWSRLRSLTVGFDVSRTIRPSAVLDSDDRRELGIGLGMPRWTDRVPAGTITPTMLAG